jgi:hypothetical protein
MSQPEPPAAPAPAPPALSWTAFALLGFLTAATVGGPLAIFLTLRGGNRPEWPPDRAVEWWMLGGTIGGYLVLLAACLLVGLVRWRRTVGAQRASAPGGRSDAAALTRPAGTLSQGERRSGR